VLVSLPADDNFLPVMIPIDQLFMMRSHRPCISYEVCRYEQLYLSSNYVFTTVQLPDNVASVSADKQSTANRDGNGAAITDDNNDNDEEEDEDDDSEDEDDIQVTIGDIKTAYE